MRISLRLVRIASIGLLSGMNSSTRIWKLVAAFGCLLMPLQAHAGLRVGAAAVDVTPLELPVIQNGGFLEGAARLVADPIFARALVVEGDELIAIVVVDSCMMDSEFCDRVKAAAAEKTGIAKDKIMLSATHTHSAPSVMNFCLGTRADPKYTEFLPEKIVQAIIKAKAALRPAKAAWTRFDAGDFTQTRRWILRSGLEQVDPFGEKTVRANMHPGYQNPDAIGASGPTDPWFTLLSFRDLGDEPIALLGNFSMHYFSGHAGISADYFGHYVRGMEKTGFPVAILSQGTSGDSWRADYSEPAPEIAVTIEQYAGALVEKSAAALEGLRYAADLPVGMAEKRLMIGRRLPDAKRLAWARGVLLEMEGRRPKNRSEVYAEQAIYLHENPETEVVLQAARIGGMGMTSMPNEVYALTGLKLKYGSPFELTMNVELANGASGYIPPPEQFLLGGYNTWPARTAGLVPAAETQIVEACLKLLEKVSGKPRRVYREPGLAYGVAVLKSKPKAFWRLGDLDGNQPEDAAAGQLKARFEPGVVFHLPGIGRSGRCSHFAGGRLAAEMAEDLGEYSVSFWFWNGVPHDVRLVSGYLFSRGPDGGEAAAGEHLGIGGTYGHAGRLVVFNGDEKQGLLSGKTELGVKKWHHVALVRKGAEIVVHLDGREEIRGVLEVTHDGSREIFFGGRSDNFSNLEGRMDEVAFFDQALTGKEVREHYAASAPMESPASDPQASLEQLVVPDGFVAELVAAEPLVRDPVAIDWGGDGSLWVAEMADYPYGVEDGGRVARLRDTDGDGSLDTRDDFLAGLSFPAGVMAWRNGVIITAAPDILYAEDRDGDGRAEHVEKWFSGFIEGNQQLRVNGLRLGVDGWIYCASGGHHAGFGVKTVVTSHQTGEKVEIGSRDFRFKPDGSIEPESGPSQFGRVRDDFGNWFGVQNAYPLWHYVLPDRYLRRNLDAPAPDPRKQLRGHQPQLFPAKETQKRFHGFDHVGRFTSACGISIYRDELLFPRVAGETIAFTCAPFHNVVQRHVLRRNGMSFTAERAGDGETDFFASRDRWCRPVMSRTGPDGALWVVDMYRYMIEHPDWLPPEGKDELRPHYRAGEDRGRIYRIFPEGKRPEMFAGLEHVREIGGNGIVNDLVQRRDRTGGKKLRLSYEGHSPSCLASAMMSGTIASVSCLNEDDAEVRALAVSLMEIGAEYPPPARLLALADDPMAFVRLQLAFSLGEWDRLEAAECLLKLALKDGADPYMRAAILSSAKPHFDVLLKGVLAAGDADAKLVEALLSMAPDEIAIPLLADVTDPSDAQLRHAARWLLRNPQTKARFSKLIGRAEVIFLDRGNSLARRTAALPLVVEKLAVFPDGIDEPELVRAAIAACCERNLAGEVIVLWAKFSPQMRSFAIGQCLSSKANALALLAAVGSQVPAVEFSAEQSQRLMAFNDATVKALAKTVFSRLGGTRAEVVEMYRGVAEIDGDVATGRSHFATSCASCHRLDEIGLAIGPDLRGITSKTKPALLSSILEPSRSVEPRYLSYSALGEKGEVLAFGMIAAETATSVIFGLLDGSEKAVARKDILSLEGIGKSLMPEGLEANLDRQAMADLLAYLESALAVE